MNILDLILFSACTAGCLRLIFYRRSGARFKRHISALAYLLILLTGGVALALATGMISAGDINPVGILLLCTLSGAICYARGNLAHIFRIARGHLWN